MKQTQGDGFKVDFLCVGFEKCGTTSLDAVLRQHSEIALPAIKEIHIKEWYRQREEPLGFIRNKFFQGVETEGRQVGIIDPSLRHYPGILKECFGEDIKIIFIMRNPVNRLFSWFRMFLRLAYNEDRYPYFSEYTADQVTEMFDFFVQREIVQSSDYAACVQCGCYMSIIRDFAQFFDEEQMKFIVFEDFIKDTKLYVDQICDFVGAKRQDIDTDLIVGDGKQISKNRSCALRNAKMQRTLNRLRESGKYPPVFYHMYEAYRDFANRFTLIDNHQKMSAQARKVCEDFYREEKDQLKKYLNADLDTLWFD